MARVDAQIAPTPFAHHAHASFVLQGNCLDLILSFHASLAGPRFGAVFSARKQHTRCARQEPEWTETFLLGTLFFAHPSSFRMQTWMWVWELVVR